MIKNLPIYNVLNQIDSEFTNSDIVIINSPPGSGKTTVIPNHLLKYTSKKIIVLEPRRLAAKTAAERLSFLLNEKVGLTVGYRIRFESIVTEITRIEFVTEGIFLKKIQNDPELSDTDIIVFDEFHERSIESDLSFTLTYETKKIFRPDLRIVIMSATIDTIKLQEKLKNSHVVLGKGSLYPVEIVYLSKPEIFSNNIIKNIITNNNLPDGNILVFLPGAGEIIKAIEDLKHYFSHKYDLLPLYGELSLEEQNKIFSNNNFKNKIIFSTNIAETSITVDNISVVIDSGLRRRLIYNPESGMNSLKLERISLDSAEQRKGRAGRVKPGICFRLWTLYEEKDFLKDTPPQILTNDLSEVVLQVINFGSKYEELFWIDPPNFLLIKRAEDLLRILGALDDNGKLTDIGYQILPIPLSVRLSVMLIKANDLGAGQLAINLSILLSEKIFFMNERKGNIEYLLNKLESKDFRYQFSYSKYKKLYDYLLSFFKEKTLNNTLSVGAILALGYPDRIGQLRLNSNNTYKFSNGKGGIIEKYDDNITYEYIVAPEIESRSGNSKIFLFAEISKEEIYTLFKSQIQIKNVTSVSSDKIKFLECKLFGELNLDQKEIINPEPELLENIILDFLKDSECSDLNWSDMILSFIRRVQILNKFNPSIQNIELMKLKKSPEEWLKGYLIGINRFSELRKLDIFEIIKSKYTFSELKEIEKEAPVHFEAPSGRKIKILYSENDLLIEIKIQELFGLINSPRFIYGRLSPVFHLLSPAGRPIQITKDLESFWNSTYHEIRKELKGRYPKHPWPENPFTAQPTHKIKSKI